MQHLSSAVPFGIMLSWHLHGATLSESTSGESMLYVLDSSDLVGPGDSGISATAGSGMVCVNNFRVLGEYATIVDVTVQWSLMLGTSYFTAGIWADPNQDGMPDDAMLLATSAHTPAIAGEFLQKVEFTSPKYIGPEGTSFFVGVYWHESSEPGVDLFMGKDRPLLGESPSWNKSWTGMAPDPTDLAGSTVQRGTHRAFVIRPTGVVPEPTLGMMIAMAAWTLTRRSWTIKGVTRH